MENKKVEVNTDYLLMLIGRLYVENNLVNTQLEEFKQKEQVDKKEKNQGE